MRRRWSDNRHQNLGRVHKTLKKWEGATDDAHRPGETTEDNGRTLTTNLEKATTFNRTYATVSRQVRVREVDRDAKARLKAQNVRTCHDCQGERSGYCSPFTADGLVSQISQAQLQRSPGPDNLCNEYLKHLGPRVRQTLLDLLNVSWRTGVVPQEWRRATIVPIPKAGKDLKQISSYRPIALSSHIAKLAEHVVAARLTHRTTACKLIPPEQVGFREKLGVEDALARLVQQVQDGWQKTPCPPSRRKQDGAGWRGGPEVRVRRLRLRLRVRQGGPPAPESPPGGTGDPGLLQHVDLELPCETEGPA